MLLNLSEKMHTLTSKPRNIILIFIQIILFQPVWSQTQLTTGDVAIVGYQSGFAATPTPKDRFAFVLLKSVEAETHLIFNDNSVLQTSPVQFCKNESQVIWNATSPLPAGTVIVITESDTLATFGKVNGSIAFSQSGDQVIAMQPWNGDTILLGGMSQTTWAATCATACGGANNNVTCLPPPLVNGVNAVSMNTTIQNSFLNVSQLSGTPAEILAIINNPNNWTVSSNEQPWTAGYWQFSVFTSNKKPLNDSQALALIPNPSAGKFTINTPHNWAQASIGNVLGSTMMTIKNEGLQELEIRSLPPGLYLVQIFSSDNKLLATSRLIKK